MAGKAAAEKTAGKAPEADEGLTAAPEDATRVPDNVPASVDRQYVILVAQGEPHTWAELGSITASTRPEAWEQAKVQWPDALLPPTPATPADAQAQEPVLAKVIPARNFVTVESRVEYVAPRAVAKGI